MLTEPELDRSDALCMKNLPDTSRVSAYSPYSSARPQGLLGSAIMLMAIVFTLATCGDKPTRPPREAQVVEVVAFIVKNSQLPVSSELTGRVVAAVTAEIRPQIGGIVRRRLFTEGSEVVAGQVLYEIDSTTAQTSVSDAQASLTSARVAVASAKAKAARYRDLAEIEAVSQESKEEAEAAYQQAISVVDSAQAQLEAARISLSYTNVVSPISGRIGRSNVSEGALVTANQATALATVQQLDPIYLDATQSADKFVRIRKQFRDGDVKLENGRPVVKLLKEDGSLFEQVGTLGLEDSIVDETTGTLTVRSVFPNPNNELLPGMFGRIRLEGAVMQNVLVVPQVAIRRDVKGNALAYVIDENNIIEERTLTTGAAFGDKWIVESGLQAGECIVLEGLQKVQAGSRVRLAGESALTPRSG